MATDEKHGFPLALSPSLSYPGGRQDILSGRLPSVPWRIGLRYRRNHGLHKRPAGRVLLGAAPGACVPALQRDGFSWRWTSQSKVQLLDAQLSDWRTTCKSAANHWL